MPRKKIDIDAKKVEALAAMGLNQKEICAAMGISYHVMRNRRNEATPASKLIEEALEIGKAKGVAKVANKLMQMVDEGNVTATIFYLKCKAGWRENDNINISADKGILVIQKSITEDEKKLIMGTEERNINDS